MPSSSTGPGWVAWSSRIASASGAVTGAAAGATGRHEVLAKLGTELAEVQTALDAAEEQWLEVAEDSGR